jgi:hypothetical protein
MAVLTDISKRLDTVFLQGEEWAVELTFDDAKKGNSKDLKTRSPSPYSILIYEGSGSRILA